MLNRKTFFVSFFLRRDRVMKNGTAPIMARISVNGIAKEIYTQCRTAVDKWDPAKGRATGRDRLSYEVMPTSTISERKSSRSTVPCKPKGSRVMPSKSKSG